MEHKAVKKAKKGLFSIVFGRTALILMLVLIQLIVLVGVATILNDYAVYVYGGFTVLAAVIAVFASMAFPVKMTLANAATDTSAPQGIVEVLNNLLLNVVANPVSSLVNANYVGILMWAVLLGLAFVQLIR